MRLAKYLVANWERLLFGLVGAACLFFTFRFLVAGQITAASAAFAMSFFSFFYSNLARFRRFKGLGFEAELWEDKQKEAASLIERLKSVVSIYTREIVMNNVMRGRWGGQDNWTTRWNLYDELVQQHSTLGQEIDFSALKHDMDSVFIFDICVNLLQSISKSIESAKRKARKKISDKYGSPIKDVQGHNAESEKLNAVQTTIDNLFERAGHENIAKAILEIADDARAKLEASFSITPDYNPAVLERLHAMSKVIEQRPIVVTPELLEWSNDRNEFLIASSLCPQLVEADLRP